MYMYTYIYRVNPIPPIPIKCPVLSGYNAVGGRVVRAR